MMKLHNFNIKIWAQHLVGLLGQPEQKIDADTKIRSEKNRSPGRGCAYFLKLISCVSGGADHQWFSVCSTTGSDGDRALRFSYVDGNIAGSHRRGQIIKTPGSANLEASGSISGTQDRLAKTSSGSVHMQA